jgi:tetratricopeptide (TPR) repeat protein
MSTRHSLACTLAILATLTGPARILPALAAAAADHSATILGGANEQLSNGASALEAGRIEEGLRLTLEGLSEAAAPRDIAAGHANACAAYVLLKQWDEALSHCNQAISLDGSNWRAFNNRAAIFSARGLYDLALRDIQSGLELSPDSPTLHETLRVTQRNKRIMEDLGRHSVPS